MISSLFSRIFGNKPKTAKTAKERLMLVIAHERNDAQGTPDFLPQLQQELIDVISRYITIDKEDIRVSLEKQDNCEMLAVNIPLPEPDER